MNLAHALNIKRGESIAFVGAGGKTSAIQILAQERPHPLVVTTTTHLGAWQTGLADRHVIIRSMVDLKAVDFTNDRTWLITGPVDENERLTALENTLLLKLHQICIQDKLTLLIEADGAKQRPLKAPAPYEPVVPDWVDQVVVVAGLDGVGQPLNDTWVHRPERFAELSGLALGEAITPEALVRVLGSDSGGLKDLPPNAGKILFLNIADDLISAGQGQHIARTLIGQYDRVLVGSLWNPGSDGVVFTAISQVAGVILAAGGSERLGTPKQLLDWQGKSFVRQVAENALAAGLSPVVVVTGAAGDEVADALADLPVHVVVNSDWQMGQATSVMAGLCELPPACEAVMFLLCDQPQISSKLIQQLVERFYENRAQITAPQVAGQRGNPVLFSRETFPALQGLSGDKGGRAVFSQFEVDWLPWMDERLLLDVDQPGDLEKLCRAYFQE